MNRDLQNCDYTDHQTKEFEDYLGEIARTRDEDWNKRISNVKKNRRYQRELEKAKISTAMR